MMLETVSTHPHAAYITASYAASFVGLAAMVAWVWLGYRIRLRQLEDLEKAGFGRSGKR